jgi:Flp pilus assembly protein TadG
MTLLNQRGQAAIFVALMFNVLFVFFAMGINVALVVHDKINLQNSVDLAAYYAASKQAEMLNAIAHQNYQIRQSWKLLTWRYRVLGTMGLYQGDPHPVWTGDVSDTPYGQAVTPSLCITYKPTWQEVPTGENLCNRPNLRIPPLPEVKVIAGFLGINHGIAALSRQLRAQFDFQCQRKGAYNWWFSMSILHAFRLDQRNRKQFIYALADNLSKGQQGDFTDLDGQLVSIGAKKTFEKNLTFANRQAFGNDFQMFNSLQGVDRKQWLPEVQIAPTMIYTDVNNEAGCNADPQPVSNLPQRSGAVDLLNQAYPQGLQASDLFVWRTGNVLADSDFQYSIGVEKNPWFMPYIGIKVKTTPRQIFFPFGSGIEMVARSYAKPFGGRIGPWYSSRWDRGNPCRRARRRIC